MSPSRRMLKRFRKLLPSSTPAGPTGVTTASTLVGRHVTDAQGGQLQRQPGAVPLAVRSVTGLAGGSSGPSRSASFTPMATTDAPVSTRNCVGRLLMLPG